LCAAGYAAKEMPLAQCLHTNLIYVFESTQSMQLLQASGQLAVFKLLQASGQLAVFKLLQAKPDKPCNVT
jgi:hypothetical protein